MSDEKIAQILKRRLLSKGLYHQAQAARVCAVSQDLGGGEFVAVSYKNGTLKIKAKSSAGAYLLKIQHRELAQKINASLGSEVVKKIIVCVGD